MKSYTKLLTCFIITLFQGCIFYHTPSINIVSITPNKTVYHPNELMTLNVTLESSENVNKVTIKVTGLKNRIGRILLHQSKVINLSKGINNIVFYYRMPLCTPCDKLDMGTYPINITVSYNGKIIDKGVINIQLEQK